MRLTNRSILLFWAPLAATWLMMAVEGPFVAAIIARLGDPKFNLAAYGVAFAFAILVEAPVMMLMSAATALVEDASSYRKLRNFAHALNIGSTALLLLILVPPFYHWLMRTVLGLPAEVADLTYGALWFFLPWPAAIGIRRFLQGVLIRSARTRLVALGTVVRLLSMAATALTLFFTTGLPGAWVGAAALSAGVCFEAVAVRLMATGTVRELLTVRPDFAAGDEAGSETGNGAEGVPNQMAGADTLGYRSIARFYYPLALTSLIGLSVQPMLTFFMGRAPSPVESLAVFPVVHSLGFIFRALGLSYQDAAIALIGKQHEHFPELARFGLWLGLGATAGLALVVFTPLATVWFEVVSGLTPELTSFALTPSRIMVPIAGLSVLLSLERAVLILGQRTGPITTASAVEVAGIAILFLAGGWLFGLVGATAAFVALLGGRLAANLYLLPPTRAVVRTTAPPDMSGLHALERSERLDGYDD